MTGQAGSSPGAQFVIGPLVDRLRVARGEVAALAPWIATAEKAPDAFVEALLRHLGQRRGNSMESSPGRLEAYQDLVVGQLERRKPLLVEKSTASERSMGAAELHAHATRLAATWADLGVAPGLALAIVMTPGIESTIAMLAGLRIGVSITWIPPLGKTFILDRLLVLAPEFVVASESLHGTLEDYAALFLPLTSTRGVTAGPSRGFSYSGDDVVFRLYSPYSREPFDLFELKANEVLSALLRCAFFGIAGDGNDVLLWPELDELTHEPLFTMSALLLGTARVFCKKSELLAHPEWLASLKVTLLGVGPELREMILRLGPEVAPAARAWLRDISEPFDSDRTYAFEKKVESARWRRTDLFHVAAASGLLAFGVQGATPALSIFLPAPGLAWMLLDPVGTGKPATGTLGLFARKVGDEPDRAAACFAFAKQGDGWMEAGSTIIGRWGRTYPRFEACSIVRALPFVEEVDVVVSSRATNDGVVSMVVFVDPSIGSVNRHRGGWIKKLNEALAYELGEEFLPDAYALLPVRPRYTEKGEFDSAWLSSEWVTGALEEKANDPSFILFARLARIFAPPRES